MEEYGARFYPLMLISVTIFSLVFNGYFWITDQLVPPEKF